MSLQVRKVDEYYCKEHDFRTTDPRKAVRHIKADLVDEVFKAAAKVTKAALGVAPV